MAKFKEKTRYITLTNQVRFVAFESLENVSVDALKARAARKEHKSAIAVLKFDDEAEEIRAVLYKMVRLLNRLSNVATDEDAVRSNAEEMDDLEGKLKEWNEGTTVLELSLNTLEAIISMLEKAPYNGKVNHLLEDFEDDLAAAKKDDEDNPFFVDPSRKAASKPKAATK